MNSFRCLLTGLALFGFTACDGPADTPPRADLSIPLPDFSLTERSGETVTKADLEGKVWVASFVFTRCAGPCPKVSATMARLQNELKDESDVRLVTFTVDPEYDDPTVLSRYARNFSADPERWWFLTGEEEQVHTLLRGGFKIGVGRNEPAEPGDEFSHSTKLVVVDQAGNIRGYFDGVLSPREHESEAGFDENLRQLKELVRHLLQEDATS